MQYDFCGGSANSAIRAWSSRRKSEESANCFLPIQAVSAVCERDFGFIFGFIRTGEPEKHAAMGRGHQHGDSFSGCFFQHWDRVVGQVGMWVC